MAAALAEFRVNGLAGASIERIAKTAGVTRSAIYRRYTDKQQLFARVMQAQIETLQGMADALIQPSDDPLLALRRTAEAYSRFVLTSTALDLQRIVIWEAAASPRNGGAVVDAIPAGLTDQIDRRVVAAQEAGLLRPGPVELWRTALLRLVTEGPRWQALASGETWSEKRIRSDFDGMWKLFLAMTAAEPPT